MKIEVIRIKTGRHSTYRGLCGQYVLIKIVACTKKILSRRSYIFSYSMASLRTFSISNRCPGLFNIFNWWL